MTTRRRDSTAGTLSLVDMVVDFNLNHCNWKASFLSKVQRDHGLTHGQAVVFCNKKQDRYRLVANLHGQAVLVLPPTDTENRQSLYLKINAFLRQLKTGTHTRALLDTQAELAKERIERRKKLAKEATKRKSQRAKR